MPVLLGPFVCPISVSNDLMAVKGAAVLEKKRKGEERGRDTAGRTMTDCGPKEEEDGDVCRTRPPAVPGAEKSAFASGAAAIVTCCVLHPLDLIKTRLQVSSVSSGAIPTYASTLQTAKAIWRVEGHRGLWKGVTATAAASGLSWGIFRYLFDLCRFKFATISLLGDRTHHASASSSVSRSSCHGASASSWSSTGPEAGGLSASSSSSSSAGNTRSGQAYSQTLPARRESKLRGVGEEEGLKNLDMRESPRSALLPTVVSPERDEPQLSSQGNTLQDERPHGAPLLWTQPEMEEDVEGISSSTSFKANLAASLVAGLASTLLSHPLWLAKARMEMQAFETRGRPGWPHYRNPLDCLLSIGRQGGLKALYAGLGPAIMLVPHAALQIIVYEDLKKRGTGQQSRGRATEGEQKTTNLSSSSSGGFGVKPFVWGAVSKCVAITATYPLQVLRARQQVANSPYGSKNFFQIARLMIRSEGVQALFGGYVVHLQRACLQNGIMFLVFEHFVHSMGRKRDPGGR